MTRLIFVVLFVVGILGTGNAKDGMLCICTTPGSFTITSTPVTPTSVTLNWSASSSSQGYDVYMKLTTSGSFTFVTNTGSTTATISSLVAGQSYDFRVVSKFTCINDLGAVCGSRETNSSNTPTVVTSPPVVPSSLSNSALTQTTFTANWTASPGATGYALELFNGALLIYSNSSITGNSHAVSDPDISAGNTYTWKVRALGANGNHSGFALGISVTTVPPNPGGLGATGHSVNSVTLSWNAANGATGYRLDVAANSSFSPKLPGFDNLAVGSTSMTVGSLNAGTTYHYRVRAENGSGVSGSAQANTITLCAAPATDAATNIMQDQFKAKWMASTGATSYRLDVSVDDFASLLTNYNNLTVVGTEQVVSGLSAGTTYKYRVRAVNASGTSSNSTPATVPTIPAAPTVTSANSVTQSEFNARWNAATGATGYRLDVSKNNFSSFVLSDVAVTGTSKLIDGLEAGTVYQYRVRASNASGISGSSDVGTVTLTPPNPTSLQKNNITQTSFELQWASALGASSYRVDVSNDNFTSLLSGYNNLSVPGTTLTVNGLSAGLQYQARVRAINSGGTSGSSTPATIDLIPTDPVVTDASDISQNSFVARWQNATGASEYLLDVSGDNFNTFLPGYNGRVVTAQQQMVSDLTAGRSYKYRVRGKNGSGVSGSSSEKNVLLVPGNPTATDPTAISLTSFTANWNAVEGAVDYRLDVSNDQFASLLTGYNNLVVTGTSQAINGLPENQTYQYRVRSSNPSGVSGNSNVVELALNPTGSTALAASEITTTSFKANWTAVVNAQGYKLDVSNDNFVTRLSGFDDLQVSGTSLVVNGLSSGSSYQYRVRTMNSTGVSGNSNAIEVLLLPSAPLAPQAQDVAVASASLSWQPVSGASSYRLDLSTDQFSTFVPGFENLTVSGLSKALSDLSSGTFYQFRLRAVNSSGSSANSPMGSLLTLPAAPTFSETTNLSPTGFDLSWSAVTGAAEYRLDVATNPTFTNYVQDFQNRSVGGTTIAVTGLSPGLTYHIRVRALNATGLSANSVAKEQMTIPSAPLNLVPTDRQLNRFVITWAATPGASLYEVEVATDDQFVNRLSNYSPKEVATTELSVTGLSPGTFYYVRVKAKNNAGTSGFSAVKTVSTLSTDGGGNDVLRMDPPSFAPVFSGTGASIAVTITGGVSAQQVTLHHRAISGTDFSHTSLTYGPTSKSFAVDANWLDELGMEFYLTVTDGETTLTSDRHFMKTSVEKVALPAESFGGKLQDYRIISLPFNTEAASIENLFEPTMGAYNQAKWRLVRYQNNRNVDYEDGLSKTKMDRGKGYWFNTLNKVEISWGAMSTPDNNQATPFNLTLEQGWNQIGNPYPFTLDWEKVKAFNPDVELGDVLVYDHTAISLKEANVLPVFSGGFVWADRAMNVKIPVTAKPNTSGRLSSKSQREEWREGEWLLDLQLDQGAVSNTLSGFGMHAEAREDKDRFDMPLVPRFGKYLEWKTADTQIPLSRSVVRVMDRHQWRFDVKSNSNERITLRWNRDNLPEGQLILEDLGSNTLIDMTKSDSYEFSPEERQMIVHFDRFGTGLTTKELQMGSAYPNPAATAVHFNYAYTGGGQPVLARLRVSTMTGLLVEQIEIENHGEGIQTFTWDLEKGNKPAPGLYLYELKVDGRPDMRGKIVIE